MAEVESGKAPSLAEQYSLEKEQKPVMGTKPVDVTKDENPVSVASEEVVNEKTKETPAISQESDEVTPPAVEESSATTAATAAEKSSETAEKSSETAEQEGSGDQEAVEQTPEIKIKTAPADFRFPTTNQTRHCFTRYVEYHRCIAAKGEDAPECDKFAKYYRSLCPGEWIDRWNEQRENGTFPGPL